MSRLVERHTTSSDVMKQAPTFQGFPEFRYGPEAALAVTRIIRLGREVEHLTQVQDSA